MKLILFQTSIQNHNQKEKENNLYIFKEQTTPKLTIVQQADDNLKSLFDLGKLKRTGTGYLTHDSCKLENRIS